jgi:hypothetical protein
MFGFMKKRQDKFSYNQAVILELSSHSEFLPGTGEFINTVTQLEDAIKPLLPKNAGIDGHDISDTECIVYIYGESAADIWQHIEGTVKATDFININVTLQYGDPRDKNTKDKKFTVN